MSRGMVLLLIQKIRNARNPGFVPFLKVWQMIEYRKVREKLQTVINYPEGYQIMA